jgi:diguanylate cyclase (GGDEF)-like protein
MIPFLWRAYLGLGALIVGAYVFVPAGLGRDALYVAVGVSSAAAITLAVSLHRPLRRAPWWFMAGGIFAWSGGDALYSWFDHVRHTDPFPSAADALYLGAYVLFGAGFVLLVRGRRSGRDREGLIDSSIFTVALGLLSWVFLMRPTVADTAASGWERSIGLAYPLADVLLLGLLVRLVTSPGARTTSFRLLAGAGAALLAADSIFCVLNLYSSYDGGLVDLLWLASYVLWGAAALHPSMRTLSEPAPEPRVSFTRRRLLALTMASLTSPGTLAVQLLLGMVLDAWAVVLSSVVLFLLVIARMSGLLSHVQEQAGLLADLARTDSLTGLPNRRTADAELDRLRERADALALPLTVAMIDLDRFKLFNDTFGHQAGDRLLTETSNVWRSTLGRDLFLARYGGEEFVVLALGHTLEETATLINGLRQVTPAGQTFSAGVAQWDRPREGSGALLNRADLALYSAKRHGRDRVVTVDSTSTAASC